MRDLIDRQAAIDALREYLINKRVSEDGTLTARLIENEVINKLPSAEPQLVNESQGLVKDLVNDVISRQAIIDYFVKTIPCDDYGYELGEDEAREMWTEIINKIPSAEPQERKTGKWILDRSGAYCCSECMETCATYVMLKPRDRFCKMCGARMEADNEQTQIQARKANHFNIRI